MLSKAQGLYVLKRIWQGAWRYVRHVSGDDAYERYLQHCAVYHPDETPLNRKDYFRREQSRKWDGIRRCC